MIGGCTGHREGKIERRGRKTVKQKQGKGRETIKGDRGKKVGTGTINANQK